MISHAHRADQALSWTDQHPGHCEWPSDLHACVTTGREHQRGYKAAVPQIACSEWIVLPQLQGRHQCYAMHALPCPITVRQLGKAEQGSKGYYRQDAVHVPAVHQHAQVCLQQCVPLGQHALKDVLPACQQLVTGCQFYGVQTQSTSAVGWAVPRWPAFAVSAMMSCEPRL